MTEEDKAKIGNAMEVGKSKAKTIWTKYMAFCGKVYDFFAMICRGQRKHTPETLKISQKRGTWIVTAFVALAVIGAFTDDEESKSESTSASDAELDNIVSETADGGIAESSEDEPLVPEKLPGWIKLPKNVDMGLSLRNAGSPNFKPVKGNIYIHIAGLKVGQFDGETAFAHPANDAMSAFANLDAAFSGNVGGISSGDDDHMIAIKANDEYASGEQVRPGAYEYVGVDTYKTVFEAKVSLRVFKELPEKKSKEILDAVINNRKLLNAESERREEAMKRREEAARKAKEAAKRAAKAKEFSEKFTPELFDKLVKKVLPGQVVVQKSEQDRIGALRCPVIDYMRGLAAKGEWEEFSSRCGNETAGGCWTNIAHGLQMVGGPRYKGYEVLFGKMDLKDYSDRPMPFDPRRDLEPDENADNSLFVFGIDPGSSIIVFRDMVTYEKRVRICNVPWRKTFIARLGVLKKFCREHADVLGSMDVKKVEEALDAFLQRN